MQPNYTASDRSVASFVFFLCPAVRNVYYFCGIVTHLENGGALSRGATELIFYIVVAYVA